MSFVLCIRLLRDELRPHLLLSRRLKTLNTFASPVRSIYVKALLYTIWAMLLLYIICKTIAFIVRISTVIYLIKNNEVIHIQQQY